MSSNFPTDQPSASVLPSVCLDLNADAAGVADRQDFDVPSMEAYPGSAPETLTETLENPADRPAEEAMDDGGTEARHAVETETDLRESGRTGAAAKQEGLPDPIGDELAVMGSGNEAIHVRHDENIPSMEAEVVVRGSLNTYVGTEEAVVDHTEERKSTAEANTDFTEGNKNEEERPSLEMMQEESDVVDASAEAANGSLNDQDQVGGQESASKYFDDSEGVEVGQGVEVQDMNLQTVDRNSVDMHAVDDKLPGNRDFVMAQPIIEAKSQGNLPNKESPRTKGDVLMEDLNPIAASCVQMPVQSSDDKGVGRQSLPPAESDSSQGTVSALPFDMGPNKEAPSEDAHLIVDGTTGKIGISMHDLNSAAEVSVSVATQQSETQKPSEDMNAVDNKLVGNGDVVLVRPIIQAHSQGLNPADESPKRKREVIMEDLNPVAAVCEDKGAGFQSLPCAKTDSSEGTAFSVLPFDVGENKEAPYEDAQLVVGGTTGKTDISMHDINLTAEISVSVASQPSETQSFESQAIPSNADIFPVLLLDENRSIGKQSEDAHSGDLKETGGGDVVVNDSSSIAKVGLPNTLLVSEGQEVAIPLSPSIDGDINLSQVKAYRINVMPVNEDAHPGGIMEKGDGDVSMDDSNSVAKVSLQSTMLVSEVQENARHIVLLIEGEKKLSQVEVYGNVLRNEDLMTETQSAVFLRGDIQSSEVHYAEAPTYLPSSIVDRDTSSGGTEEDIGYQPVKYESSSLEGSCSKEVNQDKKSEANAEIPRECDGVKNGFTVAGIDIDHQEEVKELKPSNTTEKPVARNMPRKPGTDTVESDLLASCYLPLEEKTEFAISDLVWGKVKSHPWWPGQIFDPSDASELALKHQKKDNFLVAYFGDQTFAWCEESHLKPFRSYFSQMEKQSSSDAFDNAVNGALDEISRRVELGLMCTCMPEEAYAGLKKDSIENAGIREGASTLTLNRSLDAASFLPDLLLAYVKALACSPFKGADRLELIIAKAQLLSFYRSKGYLDAPVFTVSQGLERSPSSLPAKRKRVGKKSEVPFDSVGKRKPHNEGNLLHKQKRILEDSRKQKSLSELMHDKIDAHPLEGGRNGSEAKINGKDVSGSFGRRSLSIYPDDANHGKSKKKKLDSLGDLEVKSPQTLSKSFNVGECIRRAASQLTGSPPVICSGETIQKSTAKLDSSRGSSSGVDAFLYTPEEPNRIKADISRDYPPPHEMLSQLRLAARDPMKGYGFLPMIINFFTDIKKLYDCNADEKKVRSRRGRKVSIDYDVHSPEPSSPLHKVRRKRVRRKSSACNADSSGLSTALVKIGRKRGWKKLADTKIDSPETSTPDYMKDSYWTDRVLVSSPSKTISRGRGRGRKRKGDNPERGPVVESKGSMDSLTMAHMLETAKHLRVSAVSPIRNRDSSAEKLINFFGAKCAESSPTALILSFNGSDALPSETDFIRIFSRYGPLIEADTEVLKKNKRAKVVFKRRADAEVAFSSAGKFSIFGPALVSYRLKPLPSTSKSSSHVGPHGLEVAAPMAATDPVFPAREEIKDQHQSERVEATEEDETGR